MNICCKQSFFLKYASSLVLITGEMLQTPLTHRGQNGAASEEEIETSNVDEGRKTSGTSDVRNKTQAKGRTGKQYIPHLNSFFLPISFSIYI